MEYKRMKRTSLPYLRILTNPLIDEDVAVVLLENAGLEKMQDILTVRIIGKEAMEQTRDAAWEDPVAVFGSYRRRIPVFGDRLEEIRYLLQPNYKEYLRLGMRVLSLV